MLENNFFSKKNVFADDINLVPVVEVRKFVEYIQLQDALQRESIPFYIKKTNPLMADGFDMLNGPYLFLVPQNFQARAIAVHNAVVSAGVSVFTHCPACDAAIQNTNDECAQCGLFLG